MKSVPPDNNDNINSLQTTTTAAAATTTYFEGYCSNNNSNNDDDKQQHILATMTVKSVLPDWKPCLNPTLISDSELFATFANVSEILK